jgi:F-type H+-transporting ATPase subunit a
MVFVPIILWDNGIHLFSSSRFNHGEAVAESNGNFYVIIMMGKYKQMHLEPNRRSRWLSNGRPIDFSITDVFSSNRVF